MTQHSEAGEVTLIAFNNAGRKKEFVLKRSQRQYSIGRLADLSLDDLIENPGKRTLDAVTGYLTYIGDNWYFRAAKGFRRGIKAVYLNDKHIYSASPEVALGAGDVLAFGDTDPIKAMILVARKPKNIKSADPHRKSEFDEFRIEFEQLTQALIKKFDLKTDSKPETVMQEFQRRCSHDQAFEYGLIRVMRNMIAHPSPGFESINSDYFEMSRRLMTSLTQYANHKE